MSRLNDFLWEQIDRILADRKLTLAQFRRAVYQDHRHDNTLYNWRKKKTIMKIDDLERIAAALQVSAASLVAMPPDDQMMLPFESPEGDQPSPDSGVSRTPKPARK